MQEKNQSSGTDSVAVSEVANEPELPVSVVSPDGDSWEPEVPAAENPEAPEAGREQWVEGIKKVLELTVKEVVVEIRATEDVEILILTRELERAGKSRKTVLKALRTRLNHLMQAEPAAEVEPEYVAPRVKVSVKGNINEIPGSFWDDEVGNIFVLDNKMGAPSGTFALRLFRRPGG